MSDVPETIYTNKSGTMIITPPAMPLHETDLAWCRDDLPATDVQAMQNEKVKALVALLREYREKTPLGHQPHMIAHRVDAALAAIKEGQDDE